MSSLASKVLIVGGVAGGASAAARLRRLNESAEITVIERGPYISFANCGLPYHLSGTIRDRDDLLLFTAEDFEARFHARVLTRTEVIEIHTQRKMVTLRSNARTWEEPYGHLVLSPGAAPIRPKLPGLDHPRVLTLRNIPDMDAILHALQANGPSRVRRVAVVGAGFIGLEVLENLMERGLQVELVEKAPQVMPLLDSEISAFLSRDLLKRGAHLHLGAGLSAVEEAASGLKLKLDTGQSLEADLVVLAIGVRPETALATQAGLQLGQSGGILVDDWMRTSVPDIYAVGDAIEIPGGSRVPLAGPANKQGRLVADVIACTTRGGNPELEIPKYGGAQGTSILKLFDQTAASTGLSERTAKAQGKKYRAIWINAKSHAGYYPGAETMLAKILINTAAGTEKHRILGAQIVGGDGVDKRIDVIATAMALGARIEDLAKLDLAYAPPYGSAKDVINHLATVSMGVLNGEHPAESWQEFETARSAGETIVDVRSVEEFNRGSVPGAISVDIDTLRSRLHEIPRSKRVHVFCQIGVRGYLATRILKQSGFDAVNLMGGYRLWETVVN